MREKNDNMRKKNTNFVTDNITLKAKLMKNNQMKMVHDKDLENLLRSLGIYENVIENKCTCLFCGQTMTLDNIDSIVPHNNTVQFTCDKEECHLKLIGWKV